MARVAPAEYSANGYFMVTPELEQLSDDEINRVGIFVCDPIEVPKYAVGEAMYTSPEAYRRSPVVAPNVTILTDEDLVVSDNNIRGLMVVNTAPAVRALYIHSASIEAVHLVRMHISFVSQNAPCLGRWYLEDCQIVIPARYVCHSLITDNCDIITHAASKIVGETRLRRTSRPMELL
jgi:hypothetical protein